MTTDRHFLSSYIGLAFIVIVIALTVCKCSGQEMKGAQLMVAIQSQASPFPTMSTTADILAILKPQIAQGDVKLTHTLSWYNSNPFPCTAIVVASNDPAMKVGVLKVAQVTSPALSTTTTPVPSQGGMGFYRAYFIWP